MWLWWSGLSRRLPSQQSGKFTCSSTNVLILAGKALRSSGQVATQPLIATEQFGAGGVDTVRGYLDRERFGDNAYDIQMEVRAPSFTHVFGGRLEERIQPLVFWDTSELWTLADPTQPSTQSRLAGAGVGVRASFFDHVNAELFYASPLIHTEESTRPRFHFKVAVGF